MRRTVAVPAEEALERIEAWIDRHDECVDATVARRRHLVCLTCESQIHVWRDEDGDLIVDEE